MTYDFYRAEVIIWHGTDKARVEITEGNREQRRGRASDATIRRFILDAYRKYSVPVRINWVRRIHD